MTRTLTLLALISLPACARAQSDSTGKLAPRLLTGVVTGHGAPLSGANVFDLETLDGAITGPDGRFVIAISDPSRTSVHLTARRLGYSPGDGTFTIGTGDVTIALDAVSALAVVAVQAGRYTANADRSATLTPLEVVSVPGSNADINSAIKTLPGVQNVDEGTGLFVRGGDYTETKIFVDGAPLFTAYQFQAPTGSVAGTINPFLTDGITFSSGGFGAQWGNALSGVVDLSTIGRPLQSYVNVNASLVGVAVGGGVALPHNVGLSATLSAANTGLLLDLNGNPRSYSPAPNSRTGSALAAWEYRRGGTIKIFALKQDNGLGIPVEDPGYTSTYLSNRSTDIVVASWRDTSTAWRPFVSASTSGLGRHDSKGTYDERSALRSTQLRGTLDYIWSDRFTIGGGAEAERVGAHFAGQLPDYSYDYSPAAATQSSSLDEAATRTAVFVTADSRPTASTELIVGARTDRSGYTTARTIDPRASLAWVPHDGLTFAASWGIYHQVADPTFLDRLQTGTVLPPLEANMAIAGVQGGEGKKLVRLEVWTKTYRDLVALTYAYRTVAGLPGHARGADFFARGLLPDSVAWRLTWSAAVSRRADPNTVTDALAPFDVTHSVTAVLEKDWRSWHAGVAWKFATGHPFTEVVSASLDSVTHSYVPQFGAPSGQRLPNFHRTDVTVSRQIPLGAGRFAVAFLGINNLLNDVNPFGYTWNADYSQRIPIRSTVSRTYFVGANLVLVSRQ